MLGGFKAQGRSAEKAVRLVDDAIALQPANVRQARFPSREFALTDEVRRGLAGVKMPVRAISMIRSKSSSITMGETPAVGSSSIRTLGWVISARPTATC